MDDSDDLKARLDTDFDRRSVKYVGAYPTEQLYMYTKILNLIRALIGSQCRSNNACFELSNFERFKTSLAHIFWIRCIFDNSF